MEIHQSGLGDSLAVQDQLRKMGFLFMLECEKHQCQKMCWVPVASVAANHCQGDSATVQDQLGHVQVLGAAEIVEKFHDRRPPERLFDGGACTCQREKLGYGKDGTA